MRGLKWSALLLTGILPALAGAVIYPVNSITGDIHTDCGGDFLAQVCYVVHYRWASPDAAAVAAIANVTPTDASARVIVSGFTNPDVPRAITMKAPTSYSGVVDVTGTNMAGSVITEAFTLSGTGTVTGSKAFKTITHVEVPANEQIQVGTSDKLGLPYCSAYTTLLSTFFDGTIEGTAPTVARDVDELEKNTIDLNSALNNKQVDVIFTWYR